MTILVTGASGFIGTYILRELKETAHSARALVRPGGSDKLAVRADNVIAVEGDILNHDALDGALEGCDAVIHLVGIIREQPSRGITFERIHAEGTANVVAAAARAGVKTFVHMSANGAGPDGVSRYQTTKWEAEQSVSAAGFSRSSIFRPSIVFGAPDPGRPEFASDLVRQLVRPFPVLPVFGDGDYKMQPIAVRSLARGMVSAVDMPLDGAVFEVAGPEAITYIEILDRLAEALGSKPKPKIHVPVPLVSAGIAALGWTGLLPITSDQLSMLLEGNTCDSARFHETFGVPSIPFAGEHLAYLRHV